MTGSTPLPALTIGRIFHPTDFSPASDVAFAHALKLTLLVGGDLTIFHFAQRETADEEAEGFPQVRRTLTAWGLLPPGAAPEDVTRLGVAVRKVEVVGDDPGAAMVDYLEDRPIDLLVLATHQRSGLARWLYKPVAEPLARQIQTMALFVPPGVEGFVSFDTGRVRLKRVLVAVDQSPRPALDTAAAFARQIGGDEIAMRLLHVGNAATQPHLHTPHDGALAWETRLAQGDVVDQVIESADELGADVLMLTTQGRTGFFDALRGSTSERIIRSARCPILTIPSGRR